MRSGASPARRRARVSSKLSYASSGMKNSGSIAPAGGSPQAGADASAISTSSGERVVDGGDGGEGEGSRGGRHGCVLDCVCVCVLGGARLAARGSEGRSGAGPPFSAGGAFPLFPGLRGSLLRSLAFT